MYTVLFPVHVGIFKNDAEPDVIVDLKGIVSLWRREVSFSYFLYNIVCLLCESLVGVVC